MPYYPEGRPDKKIKGKHFFPLGTTLSTLGRDLPKDVWLLVKLVRPSKLTDAYACIKVPRDFCYSGFPVIWLDVENHCYIRSYSHNIEDVRWYFIVPQHLAEKLEHRLKLTTAYQLSRPQMDQAFTRIPGLNQFSENIIEGREPKNGVRKKEKSN